MNNSYTLNTTQSGTTRTNVWQATKKLLALLSHDRSRLYLAAIAVFVNTGLNLLAPVLIGYTVDAYIQTKQFSGVMMYGGILSGMYLLAVIAGYVQTILMGTVGQHVLFNLRNAIFNKLQALPVAFFNQNKTGDLISRINNDTDKLNQFFSQSLIQFVANTITIVGAAIFILAINWRLGFAALLPALGLLIFTRLVSPWIKQRNAVSLSSTGEMSAEIAESLDHFKVIVAFNRRDYFQKKFASANAINYRNAIGAGIANTTLVPTYGFSASLAQLIVLGYGIYLISQGQFTIGLLISFLTYVSRLYDPLRQMAMIWSNFQIALAGWDRITTILALESDIVTLPMDSVASPRASVLEFQQVSFQYSENKTVLHNVSLTLQAGKTYALVGPTGGGKTTTASLMARLYDPTTGTILLHGQDIRSYSADERTKKIGFILQEPFLFTGTVRDNILYGNTKIIVEEILKEKGLEVLLKSFPDGLDTAITAQGNSLSLGQKQLIAFIRAVLRNPDILILDEATANIDTVTEQLLADILKQLPATTTTVIIAHRLNTIEHADEIFFVNGGTVIPAGSLQHAVELLLNGKRIS